MYMPSIFNNSVFDNFDNWMDFSFPSFNQRLYGASSSQLMKTDVKETDKDYEVSIDLPGFKKEELQIELKAGYLTVSGSREVSSTEEPKENQKDAKTTESDASKKDDKAEQRPVKYIRQERYSGNVSRSFYVGENLEEKLPYMYSFRYDSCQSNHSHFSAKNRLFNSKISRLFSLPGLKYYADGALRFYYHRIFL